jgi:hypothetical protein
MARAAVLELLRGDSRLAELGGEGFVVVAQFSYDQLPNDKGAFIVIVWRHTDFDDDIQENAEHHFDVYFHIPRKVSTDFVRIDDMNDRVDELFKAVEDAPAPIVGADGRQLHYVGFEGRGQDMTDDGYQTICRQASYMALSSKAA